MDSVLLDCGVPEWVILELGILEFSIQDLVILGGGPRKRRRLAKFTAELTSAILLWDSWPVERGAA